MKQQNKPLLPLPLLFSYAWKRLIKSLPKLGVLLLIQILAYGIYFALFVGLFFTAGLSMVLSHIITFQSVVFGHFNSSVFVIGSLILLSLWIFSTLLVQIATIRILQENGRLSLTIVFQQSLALFFPFLFFQIVYGAFLLGGLFFFVVPFFAMVFFFAFAMYAVLCDGYSVRMALRRSITLVYAYPLQLLGRFFLFFCVLSIPYVFFIGDREENSAMVLGFLLSSWVVGWFGFSYMYEVYADCSRKVTKTKEKGFAPFLIFSLFGWILIFLVSVVLFFFVTSGGIQKIIRQTMYAENRAQYRLQPGAQIEFIPELELKEL